MTGFLLHSRSMTPTPSREDEKSSPAAVSPRQAALDCPLIAGTNEDHAETRDSLEGGW